MWPITQYPPPGGFVGKGGPGRLPFPGPARHTNPDIAEGQDPPVEAERDSSTQVEVAVILGSHIIP
jgi:hypothetical protein